MLFRSGAARVDAAGNFVKDVAVRDALKRKKKDEDGNIIVRDAVVRDKLGRKKSLNTTAVRKSLVQQNKIDEKIRKLEQKKVARVEKGEKRALKKMGYNEDPASMSNEQRTEYQIARARIHMDLTRWSREDDRTADRRGSKIERDISKAKSSMDNEVESIVKSKRLKDSENLRGERRIAYQELASQIDVTRQSLREASDRRNDKRQDRNQERAWNKNGRRLLKDIGKTDKRNQSERGGEDRKSTRLNSSHWE